MKPRPPVDVVVVGAGAAGILAAWRAAKLGARTLLLEKTDRLGTKILISGGGKCNITHDGPLEDLIKSFRPAEARFIRPSCYRFTNREIIDMLTSRGLEVVTREDGRIFPTNGTAKDVVGILRSYLEEAGVEIRLSSPVTGLVVEHGRVQGVQVGQERIAADRVVLSVGGSSYPNSGTTGDGWPWAREVGHTVTKIRAALAPVYMEIEEADPRAGVALRDVLLKARREGKEIARWRGDLLFTHRGLSGPTVLGITRIVAEQMESGPVDLEADLCPDHPFESLGQVLRDWCAEHPKKSVRGLIDPLVPERLEDEILGAAGIEPSTPAGQLAQRLRNRLVEVLKGWKLGRVRTVPLEKGEVVAGGISLDEVDPQTMRSRICPGLYLCGEVLDVAGPVGGYNLQAAFATGFVAGETAAQDALGTVSP